MLGSLTAVALSLEPDRHGARQKHVTWATCEELQDSCHLQCCDLLHYAAGVVQLPKGDCWQIELIFWFAKAVNLLTATLKECP